MEDKQGIGKVGLGTIFSYDNPFGAFYFFLNCICIWHCLSIYFEEKYVVEWVSVYW